jgi:hypothetical protein
LPRSPLPGDKAAARLAQMRAIATDFSVIDYFGPKASWGRARVQSRERPMEHEIGSVKMKVRPVSGPRVKRSVTLGPMSASACLGCLGVVATAPDERKLC